MEVYTITFYKTNFYNTEVLCGEIKIEATSIKEALSKYVNEFNIALDSTRIEIKLNNQNK